jgi:branched-chain amino acid transport system substrate-binding protein
MPKRFLLLAALYSLSAAAAPVKLGVINSMTGPEAPIGENLTNGIKLAQEDLAKNGIEVELVWEDDTGKPQIALSAIEKLATRDNVAGVVGPYTSSSANAVAKLAERYKVPLLVPAAAKEEITRQGYKYVYRMNAPANVYGSVILDAVLAAGKPQTIAFIYENTDFGTSTSRTAKAYATQKGLKTVADEAYSKGTPDYRSMLSQVKAANPDLIFMVSYVADAILLMRQSRELQLAPRAFLGGGAGFTTVEFAAEKAINEGVLTSTQWTDDVNWPGAKDFQTRYLKRFGKEPSYHAACAYASMRVLAETAAKAGGDREKTREGLSSGSWNGILGPVKFESYEGFNNQNRHPMLVEQIQAGKFETVFPPEFASKKIIYPAGAGAKK